VTTAFTLMVTLSRVITSWGGTSSTSWRSEMRTICWIGLKTKMMPGPYGVWRDAAQGEDHAALVLAENLDAVEQ
jgi:hypothetical protein